MSDSSMDLWESLAWASPGSSAANATMAPYKAARQQQWQKSTAFSCQSSQAQLLSTDVQGSSDSRQRINFCFHTRTTRSESGHVHHQICNSRPPLVDASTCLPSHHMEVHSSAPCWVTCKQQGRAHLMGCCKSKQRPSAVIGWRQIYRWPGW